MTMGMMMGEMGESFHFMISLPLISLHSTPLHYTTFLSSLLPYSTT
jgi:hypothetical protein